MSSYNIITVLGHTAASKTKLAAHVAANLKGEVISADSRQVYRDMTIGTGKDYNDYMVGGQKIPVHLIDIVNAGYEYNVFEFQQDFLQIFNALKVSGTLPILCGGTGLYLESILRQYDIVQAPVDKEFRKEAESKDLTELVEQLRKYKELHNTTDVLSRKRVIRALEIARHSEGSESMKLKMPYIRSLNIGIRFERDERRRRITERLRERMDEGMIKEVEQLLQTGLTADNLEYYGLEYRYISRYIEGRLNYDEMLIQLNTAIHQFAKRQMTYFRGMERRGLSINWIEGELPLKEKVEKILGLFDAT